MRDTNLVNALREHAKWARANVYEAPIALYDDLTEAADVIERLSGQVPRWIPVDEPTGLLALLYTAAWSYAELRGRLMQYEDTGLEPAMCANYKTFEDEAISKGVTFKRIVALMEADKAGRLAVLPSNKALTNADRIRAATNQQLAKLLYDNQKEFCRLMYKNLGFEDELNFSENYSDILAWLNAPSKEAEKALEAMKDE